MDHHAPARRGDAVRQGDRARARPAAGDRALIPAFDALQIEAGRRLFSGPCDFVQSVVALDGLPEARLPEFAFAGRSNVGKSSLLNAVTGRRHLARTSAEPGRTRQLNFFRLGEAAWLVDLPGYGYARAPKTEIARWTQLTGDYLKGRAPLVRVFVLVDSRHGVKPADIAVMDALDAAAVSYQVVLTKADKLKPAALESMRAATAALLARRPAAHPAVHATSAAKGEGIEALRAEIALLVEAFRG